MPGIHSAETVADISKRLAAVSVMFAEGASADDIVAYMNWPEVIIGSEGSPIRHGVDELMPSARDFVSLMGTDVIFELVGPILASGDLASSMVAVRCNYPDRPPMVSNALYVWERRGTEWKVVREMLCSPPAD